ncbi:helix-turn-helix domain-containing protein, partial [Variovorax sp. LG9.2]|uniref:helix-turn-helix domain-containing protein n=1 Tax=Variovorax sp. LG9.2 TaxID=3048626 RepID=UPI002B23D84C
AMRSPGRPEINQRLIKRAFWGRISAGLQSEEAARASGVSQPLGPRWFRQAGGIPPTNPGPVSGRYLSFTEREEIALLHAQQLGVREIARQLGRAPSTISRELRRNAATRGGKLQYRATV